MNNGHCVLQWINQNNHTVESIAHQIGYSRSTLSQALNREHISMRMADLLYERCRLQVLPTVGAPWQKESNEKQTRQQQKRGRKPGSGEGRPSKLDKYADEIFQELEAGETQRNIAIKYNTTPSNLSNWLKNQRRKQQISAR